MLIKIISACKFNKESSSTWEEIVINFRLILDHQQYKI